MKCTTFILIVTATCVHSRMLESSEALRAMTLCKQTTGISKDDLYNFVSNMKAGVSETRQAYCRIACLSKKLRILDKDNHFNLTRIDRNLKTRIGNNAVLQIVYDNVNTCASQVMPDPDECNVVEHMFLCTINLMKNRTNAANIANQYGLH